MRSHCQQCQQASSRPGEHGGLRTVVASSQVLFGLYLAVGSAIGAPSLDWMAGGWPRLCRSSVPYR